MKLIHNWKIILRKAWSLRLMIVAASFLELKLHFLFSLTPYLVGRSLLSVLSPWLWPLLPASSLKKESKNEDESEE